MPTNLASGKTVDVSRDLLGLGSAPSGTVPARDNMLPPLTPCKIHVHDTTAFFEKIVQPRQLLRAAFWANDPFSTELSLQRAAARLAVHAEWRAPSAAQADLIFVAANLSLLCVMERQYSAQRLRTQVVAELYPTRAKGSTPAHLPPKVVSLQFVQHCQRFVNAWPVNDTLLLVDQIKDLDCRESRPGCRSAVAPFAITGPHWMTEGRSAHQTPWAERKLLFFGGHVPKPYLSSLRYEIWSQVRRDPRVTTESKTINCSVGAYVVCTHPDLKAMVGTPPRMPSDFYHKFCYQPCASKAPTTDYAHAFGQQAKITKYFDDKGKLRSTQASCIGSFRKPDQQAADKLREKCRQYDGARVASEAADMSRDVARSGGRSQFLATAAGHRFCLIAQGDPGNTAKVTETIALGGSGGCIPLYVLFAVHTRRAPTPSDFIRDLPHVRWLE